MRGGFPGSMGNSPEISPQRFLVCGFFICGLAVQGPAQQRPMGIQPEDKRLVSQAVKSVTDSAIRAMLTRSSRSLYLGSAWHEARHVVKHGKNSETFVLLK